MASSLVAGPELIGECSNEFQLMLQVARTSFDEGTEERMRDLVTDDFDWAHFLFLVRFHRVGELAYLTLKKNAPFGVKGEVENYLLAVVHRTTARNLALIGELRRVLNTFEQHDLPFIVFKGPVLGQDAYKNTSLRGSVDIDLLIRPEDLDRLSALLPDIGYQLAQRMVELTPAKRRAYIALSKQISFVNPERRAGLDVHTDVMPPGYHFDTPFEVLRERGRTVEVGGGHIPTFSVEDTLILLCFHGVKNRWDQLKYVCDIAEHLRAHTDLDWDRVATYAKAIRGERILHHGLHLSRVLLDAPVPDHVLEQIEKKPYILSLTELALSNLQHSYEDLLDWRQRARFHLQTQDTLINRSRYVLYSLLRHLGGVIDI